MSKVLYDGFLKIREVERDGQKYEVMDRGNSVNVLVVQMGKKKHHDRFLSGLQFRAGAEAHICTNVAGMVDEGESVVKAVIRETLEESGFKITEKNIYSMTGGLLNSPGGSSERTLFFVAVVNGLDQGKPTDESEAVTWGWSKALPFGSSLPVVASSLFYEKRRKAIKLCMLDRGVLTKENMLRGD